jgi:hypothetical protein
VIQPPSTTHAYDDFWSDDPAIVPAPLAPADNADEEAKAKHRTALDEHVRKLERARETGNWDEVKVPGEHPTLFSLRPIPGQAMRAIESKLGRGELDWLTAPPLAFRAAIVKISNPTVAIKTVHTKSDDFAEYGPIATVDVTNYLDAIDGSIVTELGTRILQKGTTGIAPKS